MAQGRGWINVVPVVADEDRPPEPSRVGRWFSGKGPAIPLATFVPGGAGASHTVGISHGTAGKVAARLAAAGLRLPDGSKVTQDHPKRGLVAEVPATGELDVVARFLLEAAAMVSVVPTTDTWRAEIYER